jgi:hypothetical protein
MVAKLKLEDSDCNLSEYGLFAGFYAIGSQSKMSNYWSLKWLLNNSPMFVNQIEQLSPANLLVFKRKVFDLTGAKGFDRLELAAPDVMKLGKMLKILIKNIRKKFKFIIDQISLCCWQN